MTPNNSNLIVPGNWDDIAGKDGLCQFACTPLLPNGTRKLFILSLTNLLSYTVDDDGIQYDNSSFFVNNRPLWADEPLFSEMELYYIPSTNRVLIAFAWPFAGVGSVFYNSPQMIPYHSQLNTTPNAISKPDPADNSTWTVRPNYWLSVFNLDLSSGNSTLISENRHIFFWDLQPPYDPNYSNHITGMEFINDRSLMISKRATTIDPENLMILNLTQPTLPKLFPFHPNFVNEQLFEKSYIEKGVDGNLYLHNGNHLATLNIPNGLVPSLWTWNPSLLQFNYSTNIHPDGRIPPYFLQDQIDNENSLTLAQNQNVCCQNYQFSSPNEEYVVNTGGNITWSPNNNPFNNSPNSVIVNGDIRIMPGNYVTISNLQFYFKEGIKVIVERGAGLSLNNTLFTSEECATYLWLGIELKGNPALSNPFSQGTLYMTNNSEISNAFRGVRSFSTIEVYDFNTGTYSIQPDFANSGGQIYVENSIFRNNKKDVEFYPYNHSNNSYFTRVQFVTDAVLNDGTSCDSHLSMFGVRNVKINGCTFKNSVPSQFAFTQRGYGISAGDAAFSVDNAAFPTAITKFENLTYGISASATNPINTTSVKNAQFIECHRGLYFNNIDYAIINNNSFQVGETSTTVNTSVSYGAYLENCTGYSVSDNLFKSPLHFTTQDVRGLLINNSNENGQSADANMIRKNTFEDLRHGSWAFNANVRYQNIFGTTLVLNSSGLSFKCNEYKNLNQSDIMITNGGIRPQQGSCSSATSGANNQFSAQLPTTLNYWNGNPNVTPFSSQYFYNPSIPLSHNPLIINTFNTQKTGCALPYNPAAKGNCNMVVLTPVNSLNQ